ncbi:MAG: sterol desaturase family protein [Cytophagales bacterium]|nr:sterol desaturase family protein [Cytophagales bacterium]
MIEFNPSADMKYIYPVLIGFMILEFILAKKNYTLKDSLAGFGIAAGASFVAAFTKAFTVLVVFQWVFDFFEPFRVQYIGYSSIGWAWWIWAICIVCDDFNFYWHHRFSHTIRVLWAAHLPHHSSNNYNMAVSIRNGWFVSFYKPIFWLWMAVVGFEPIMIGYAMIANGTYQYFLHTQLIKSLGFIGKVFNNPYTHQAHHSSNTEYLDTNHGGILLIWDHLFGTYQDILPEVKPKYGILKDAGTYNPIRLNTHEFEAIFKDVRRAKSLKEAWMYIFGEPGWSPDGSSKTAKELRAEMNKPKPDLVSEVA